MEKTIKMGRSETVSIDQIQPYWRNPRRIPDEAIEAVRLSIEKYGYQQPIVVDKDYVVVVGHTRLEALRRLGSTEVEVYVTDLPEEKVREYRIIDNKTSEMTSWDQGALLLELRDFERDLLEAYFPEVDLEVSLINHKDVTEEDVEEGTKKALQVKEYQPFATVEVECPACFHHFQVRGAALPGVSQEDLDARVAP